MNMIKTRIYEEKDLEGVNVILEEAFSVRKENFVGKEFKEIVAVDDEKIVGYLLLTKILNPITNRYYCLVDYVCVLKEYRGREIGKELLDMAYEIAKEEGAIYLQLTSSIFRASAHRLYEKCNFIKRDSDIFRKEIL